MVDIERNQQINKALSKLYEQYTPAFLAEWENAFKEPKPPRINEFGIIDERRYDTDNGILFICKETNGWDDKEFLNEPLFREWMNNISLNGLAGRKHIRKYPQMWYNIGRWALLLHNPLLDINELSEYKFLNEIGTIAFTNINKVRGKESAKKEYSQLAYTDVVGEVLRKEIEIIKPKIVVCCGTGTVFRHHIKGFDGKLICMEHPGARGGTEKMLNGLKSQLDIADLYMVLSRKLKEKYGDKPNEEIQHRFDEELHLMDIAQKDKAFEVAYHFTKWLRLQNIFYSVRGNTAASFLLYLLNVTNANPLKPYYFCPNCMKIVWVDNVEDGFDLDSRICGCGSPFERDGHNLSLFQFFGDDLEHLRCSIDIDVPVQHYEKICKVLSTSSYLTAIKPYKLGEGPTVHYDVLSITANEDLPEYGSGHHMLDIDAIKTYSISHYRDYIDLLDNEMYAPKRFADVLKIFGFGTGTWNLESRFKSLQEDRFAFRDDVFDYLLKAGLIIKDAWRESERVRKGKGFSENMEGVLSEHILKQGRKIMHLFPKAHAVEYLMRTAKLMYDNKRIFIYR